jgi:hypothetical protein
MKEQAHQLISQGYSVIPVDNLKRPMVSFKRSGYTQTLPGTELDLLFDKSYGIAIIAGKVSKNLICIDVDLKYDNTGDLMSRLKDRIIEAIPDFFQRAVLQQTQSGGYHLIFRCDEHTTIPGNKKLAMRNSTPDELAEDRKNNTKLTRSERVLIETRGEGGYFLVTPTPNYSLKKNSFETIGVFTSDELDAVFATCRSFSETFYDETTIDIPKSKIVQQRASNEISPWDDYNNKTDGVDLLITYGWTSTGYINSTTVKLLRPGKSDSREHSAYYHTDTNKLVVFSTSTPFDTEVGGRIPAYTPFAIYAVYEHNGDYHRAILALRDEGFGSKSFKQIPESSSVLRPKDMAKVTDDAQHSMEDPDNTDSDIAKYIGDFNNAVGYLNMARSNSLPEGLKFGYNDLDKHWRLKKGQLNIIHGLANVGKSTFMWYLAVLSAIAHGWKWVIYTGENDYEFVIRRMMETFTGKQLHLFSQTEWDNAEVFIRTHFTFITNEHSYSFRDILDIAEKLRNDEFYFDALMIDPYNSLVVDDTIAKSVGRLSGNKHDYDYAATTEIRIFCRKTGASVFLNVHTGTDGARRVNREPKHPPRMYEVEGGNKFAARADDFITVHRNTKSEEAWMFTEVHVDKVKTQETGGRPTPEDSPIVLRFVPEKGRFLAMHDGFHRFDIIDYHLTGVGLKTQLDKIEQKTKENEVYTGNSQALQNAASATKNYFLSDDEEDLPF